MFQSELWKGHFMSISSILLLSEALSSVSVWENVVVAWSQIEEMHGYSLKMEFLDYDSVNV